VSITIEPKTVGSAMSTDVAAFIARSYLMARKQIPKNANFQLWASCEFDSDDISDMVMVRIVDQWLQQSMITII
jgi:hypothetical protein